MAKILLVDDSPMNQRIAKTILEKDGHVILTADDGVQGVEKARSEKPDLILMDAEMPEMDGWTALKTIKSCDDIKMIPVIIRSGSEEAEGIENTKACGGQAYLIKPYNIATMKSKVQEVLKK